MLRIKPEIMEFINQLRAGKSMVEAMRVYCWARAVTPVHLPQEGGAGKAATGNVFEWPRADMQMMCACMAYEAFKDGKSDDRIADAFEDGLRWDNEQGVGFRVTRDGEGPAFDDLIQSLSIDDQIAATRFFGTGAVLRAAARRRSL